MTTASFASATTSLGAATAVGATNLFGTQHERTPWWATRSRSTAARQRGDRHGYGQSARPSTSTTLTAPTVANATNIKVAADSAIAAGDTLTIDSGATQENATVSAVGTPTTNSTIRTAVLAGATTVTASSTSAAANIRAGDTITIDSGASAETATVKSVSGSTITLNSGLANPHAAGATLFDIGTGVTLSSRPGPTPTRRARPCSMRARA